MNGAIAEPLTKKMRIANKSKIIIIGSNQNFFLTFKKPHKSLTKAIKIS